MPEKIPEKNEIKKGENVIKVDDDPIDKKFDEIVEIDKKEEF